MQCGLGQMSSYVKAFDRLHVGSAADNLRETLNQLN